MGKKRKPKNKNKKIETKVELHIENVEFCSTKMLTLDANPIEEMNVETAEVRVGNFLQEHSEIETIAPVVLGIILTSRLQLRGANALLANLAIASLTREVFVQLKKSATAAPISRQPRAGAALPRDAAEEYAIVHSVPGRVRLRVPRLTSDRTFAQHLETLLKGHDCVVGVRINRAAASIAIQYEAGALSEWELAASFLAILQTARAQAETAATEPLNR